MEGHKAGVNSVAFDLASRALASGNHDRDVVLWDMGGQEEYRLIHQLFLHDTTIALLLFDPTRVSGEFKEVETWNKYLEKQLRGRAVKLLVGAKLDQPCDTIDRQGVERLIKDCGFAGYYETSAITGAACLICAMWYPKPLTGKVSARRVARSFSSVSATR